MKKRWIPLILACLAAAFIFGLEIGSRSGSEPQQEVPDTPVRLNTIAVVNADAGAEVDGMRINYAAAVIDTLGYNFSLVSPAMAQTGLDSGMYSAIVTFPSNVSARILSFNAHIPERVELEFVISPALSDREFLETFIAITELQLAINTTLANTYVSSILGQFHEAQDHIDGVFQNNLLDLLALEFLTHGDFTYHLQLDYVPYIPLNPRELDREFYMGQVAMFAAEVAGWYLHSYEMASNQFLWMREGLFRLTEDFPEQKYDWLDMLTDWTRLSEEYGELLEIYSAYVRGHDLSLYEWFHENRAWNTELEDFQWHLSSWHETSVGWFDTWEVWHRDYMGYLDAAVEFREALDEFHGSLDENAASVIYDLEMFLASLEEYEQMLTRQMDLLVEVVGQYDSDIENANTFFTTVTDWHRDLEYTHEAFEGWQDYINTRQGALILFHETLGESKAALGDMLADFLYDIAGLPSMPNMPYAPDFLSRWDVLGPIPTPPTMNAVDEGGNLIIFPFDEIRWVDPNDLENLVLEAPAEPLGIELIAPDIAVFLPGNIPPKPPWDISVSADDISLMPIELPEPEAYEDISAYMFRMNIWLNSAGIPGVVDGLIADIAAQMEAAAEAAYDNIYSWRETLYLAATCPDNGWYAQSTKALFDLTNDLNLLDQWHTELHAVYTDLNTKGGWLRDWYDDLDIFHTDISGFYAQMQDFLDDDFSPWHLMLTDIYNDLYDWYRDLRLLKYGTEYPYDDDEESIHGLLYVHAALDTFYSGWYLAELPQLPTYEEWDELTTPEDTAVGLPEQPPLLGEFNLPEWYEDIFAPDPYSGANILYALTLEFSLAEHTAIMPFDMAPPPQYTGISAPDMVGEHTMMTAFQPLNPMVGAPPQPDNFWHSLNFMHSQLSSFDVNDFLSDDIHQRVDRSLQSYEAFLASLSSDINHLFSDNISRMYDVHAAYERYLQDLRRTVFSAQTAEQDALKNAIDNFAEARGETSEDNQDRLGTFASMMPESRVAGTVNQELVNFAVSPFDFVPLALRDEPAPIIAMADPAVRNFERYQTIAVIVLVSILFITITGSAVSHMVKNRKHKDGQV